MMFEHETAIAMLKARPSLAEAIFIYLNTPELFTDLDGCTLGGLMEEFEGRYEEYVWDATRTLIDEGKAYVTVPLETMTLDEYVFAISWKAGISTPADIVARFGPPHGEAVRGTSRIITYDLFVREPDDPDTHPLPPQPYAVREAANEDRPAGCSFPYTEIWPPEALQVEFTFDEAWILAGHEFKVGVRLT